MIMYALRGLAISLSMFVLVYAAMRFVAFVASRIIDHSPKRAAGISPNTWYALQVGPFLAAIVVVLFITIPSFLKFEPSAAEEEFGLPVLLLGLACLLLLGAGLRRAWTAFARTSATVREWRRNASLIRHESVEVLETGPGTPPLVVAGLFKPILLVSASAAKTLNRDELARALAHETTHVTNHDNLKKLMLRLCSFPPDHQLERRWLESIEVAADQEAVSSKCDALDLASALVKVSRMSIASAEIASHLTSETCQILHRRVERLLAWDDQATSKHAIFPYLAGGSAVVVAVISLTAYHSLLLQMHSLAELLMR